MSPAAEQRRHRQRRSNAEVYRFAREHGIPVGLTARLFRVVDHDATQVARGLMTARQMMREINDRARAVHS